MTLSGTPADFPASDAESCLPVVDHTELTRCDSLDQVRTLHLITGSCRSDHPRQELVRMADLEADFLFPGFRPGIFRNEMKVRQPELPPVLMHRVISPRYEQQVLLRVLVHHEPWPSAQSQSLPLSDGVKPESLVRTDLPAAFQFHDCPGRSPRKRRIKSL